MGYNGEVSGLLEISASASIIQGSALGPASYVINAADLAAKVPGNLMVKHPNNNIMSNIIRRCAPILHVLCIRRV